MRQVGESAVDLEGNVRGAENVQGRGVGNEEEGEKQKKKRFHSHSGHTVSNSFKNTTDVDS